MSSMQEWQDKVDEDFPHGALISNSHYKDPDGTPTMWRTAAVTVSAMTETGLPVFHVWFDAEFEKDAKFPVLSYDVTRGAALLAKIRTPDRGTWLLSDNISAKLAVSSEWKALRIAQRAISLGQEVSPQIKAKIGFNS